MAILTFIVVFGLLVFIHELGHCAAAKLNGIMVYEFAIGMGPKIFSKKWGETVYSLRLLPLGGYVKMNEDELESDDPRSFVNKSAIRRFSVIIAGPVMNLLLAVVIMIVVFMIMGFPTNKVGGLDPAYPAYSTGLRVEDEILQINEAKTKTWNEVITEIQKYKETTFKIKVERDGEVFEYLVPSVYDESLEIFRIGISTKIEKDIMMSGKFAVIMVKDVVKEMSGYISRLFIGKEDFDQVQGVVGIAQLVGNATKSGFIDILYLAAMLSINLGVINLVPFPALDGGRLIFIIVEMIFRKPVPKEKEAYVHLAGFVILMGLMVFLVTKDVSRIIGS